jgi:diamine N-acetyltransferase
VIDEGLRDRRGQPVTLRPVDDDNWRAVADVVPRDDQRDFVAPSAARYLLLSSREGVWQSLAVATGEEVVGHVMWAWDDEDGAPWIGGMVVDAGRQGCGIGRAAVITLARWLLRRPDADVVRLSVDDANTGARRLYAGVGFAGTGRDEDGEAVLEVTAERLAAS